ncbi:MAG TPA: endonuclease III [Xanthobacteraceae bacterium]|nr:endonuclease III [Xanthobacteraceae bacterium]
MVAHYRIIMVRKMIPRKRITKPSASRPGKPGRAKTPAKPPPRRRAPVAAAAAVASGGAARPGSNAEIREVFRRFQAADPEPRGELKSINPFTLLVAVVLSAQATDAGVNKATPALFAAADTPAKMAALGEERVQDYIKTIGLFRTKARNVIALSRRLVAEHGGEVPRDRAALEALPGVGRKTANVVLNTAFGQPTIAVDTHIFRVGNRTGLAPGKTPLEVESRLEQAVPDEFKLHAHHWLILHGRYICKAVKPACDRCLINDLCRWPDKTA